MITRQTIGVRTNSGVAACVGLAVVLLLGACASNKDAVRDESVTPASPPRETPVGAAPACLNENDEPVECELDEDCCSGFVCGKDPELNPRKKYCIFGG